MLTLMHTGDAICLNPHMEMLPNIKFEKKIENNCHNQKKKATACK